MRKTTLVILAVCSLAALASYLAAGETPGKVTLGSIAEEYEAVEFDHATHLYYMESCGQCHHQHARSSELRCTDCHALEEKVFKESVVTTFLACTSCHGEYDPERPAVPGLKAAYHNTCFQCHKGMGNIGSGPEGCTEQCHGRAAG